MPTTNVLLQPEKTETMQALSEPERGDPQAQIMNRNRPSTVKPAPDYEALLLSRVYALILSWSSDGEQSTASSRKGPVTNTSGDTLASDTPAQCEAVADGLPVQCG